MIGGSYPTSPMADTNTTLHDRRDFLRCSACAIAGIAALSLPASCGGDGPTGPTTPTKSDSTAGTTGGTTGGGGPGAAGDPKFTVTGKTVTFFLANIPELAS